MPESLADRFQNLHEFIKAARTNLNRNAWDYLIGASETETTVARNRMALDSLGFRPRVLCDVSEIDRSSAAATSSARSCTGADRLTRIVRVGRRCHGRQAVSRGTDVVKAMILGACGCGRGRPGRARRCPRPGGTMPSRSISPARSWAQSTRSPKMLKYGGGPVTLEWLSRAQPQ